MAHRFEWLYGLIVPVIVLIVTVAAARAEQRRNRRSIRVNGREVEY